MPDPANAETTPAMIRLRPVSLANAYALIALVFGAFFLVVTPPFGVGDETAHFERSYEVAKGRLLGAEGLPSGMQDLIDDAFGRVKSGDPINSADYRRWREIDLNAKEITPWPEPIRAVLRLHSPLCYVHLAPVTSAGVALNLPPLTIFYLGRLAAFAVGVFLVRAAIARAPAALRPPMVFVALLPTAIVFFAGLNIESLLVGLGFYYFALVASLAAEPDKKLARREIALLAATAFLFGQFKTGYMLAPAFALILPRSKFASRREQILVMLLCIAPGMIASLAWASVVKTAMLGDLVYTTDGVNRVAPSEQLARIFADPIDYAGVLLNTFFGTQAVGVAWKSMLALGGWTNIPVSIASYIILTEGFLFVWASGPKPPPALISVYGTTVQLGIFLATTLAIFTLVYLQWDSVGAPAIDGFQGRYWLAIMPLLFAATPVRWSLFADPRRRIAVAIITPLIGLTDMAFAATGFFYR